MKLVHEEISDLLSGWKDNLYATPAQRMVYGTEKGLARKMLGNEKLDDGRDCLRLLRQDGWDGGYVGSVSSETARQYFFDHAVWPDDRDLFRIGMFFHVGLCRTLALIIKGRWEQFLVRQLKQDEAETEASAVTLIETCEGDEKYRETFEKKLLDKADNTVLDMDALYDMIQSHGEYLHNKGYDKTTFIGMIRSMAAARLYTADINGKTMDAFIKLHDKEQSAFSKADDATKRKYVQLKTRWYAQIHQIDELIKKQQDIRRDNSQIKAEWAAEFGEKQAQILKLKADIYERTIELEIKELNRAFSREEVKQAAQESIENQRQKLAEDLKTLSSFVIMHKMMRRGMRVVRDMPMDGFEKSAAELQQEKTRIIRKIYKRTHTDWTKHHDFNKEQRAELLGIFQNLTQIMDLQMVELPVLEGILKRADRIWRQQGLDAALVEVFPEGDTMEAMVKEAVERLKDLEEEETGLRNELHLLVEDEEVNIKEMELYDATSIEKKHRVLDQQIECLSVEKDRLDGEYDACFEAGESV